MKKPPVRMHAYVDPRGFEYGVVDIDLLMPDAVNPRIPGQESALDSILALQSDDADGLFALAKDIVEQNGTSPSELLNVTRTGPGSPFVVKEGNRRIAARRILRNPEILRGHVTNAELDRWLRLASRPEARSLATEMFVVIGDDHEVWIDRRHLGPAGGVGVQPWRPEAKARRAERRRGTKDRTLALLDALEQSFPDRFAYLRPPERTFTTFGRVLESSAANAHIGVDVDADGNVRLTKGERSLRLLEEILSDLRKPGRDRLTSRKIHDAPAILRYLDDVDSRLEVGLDARPVTLVEGAAQIVQPKTTARSAPRKKDALAQLSKPTTARPAKLYEELRKLRRHDLPNAAIVVTRVLLEIMADDYARENSLAFAGDRNVGVEEEIKNFQAQLSVAGVQPSKAIREILKFAPARPLGLNTKLDAVIRDLISKKRLDAKEGHAKIRELSVANVFQLLNDAVHRLENVPNMDRVDHILEIMRPIHNAMLAG